MVQRKRRTVKEIKESIIRYLEGENFPRTTGHVAEGANLNWNSANKYLRQLKEEGSIYHEKVGRQNQWCIIEKYKYGFVGYKKKRH
jgi:predicted transcriptional regulator